MNVPRSGRNSPSNIGAGRFINFTTPAMRFTKKSPEDGLYVLDVISDSVSEVLRGCLAVPTIYIMSKNVLLT
jgi:hypothetical protein